MNKNINIYNKINIMKYRIKQITYADGTVRYLPYVRETFFWPLSYWDSISYKSYGLGENYNVYLTTRESALACIDEHYAQHKSNSILKIDFEYINK